MATSAPPPVSRLISATTSCSLKLRTTSAPIRLRELEPLAGRCRPPITSDAPASRAPAVAQSPIGPCANTATASPSRTCPRSAAEKPVDMMSGHSRTSSSASPSGIFAEVRLRVGNEDVLGLAAVDRVAEAPAADRLVAVAAVTALRRVARQARAALAARRDRAGDHAIADGVAGDARAQRLDHADRLVADDQALA